MSFRVFSNLRAQNFLMHLLFFTPNNLLVWVMFFVLVCMHTQTCGRACLSQVPQFYIESLMPYHLYTCRLANHCDTVSVGVLFGTSTQEYVPHNIFNGYLHLFNPPKRYMVLFAPLIQMHSVTPSHLSRSENSFILSPCMCIAFTMGST